MRTRIVRSIIEIEEKPPERLPHEVVRSATLTSGLRSPEARRQYGRAIMSRNSGGELMCRPLAGQGSHFVADLSRANAIFIVPEDVTDLVAGEQVDVILLDD